MRPIEKEEFREPTEAEQSLLARLLRAEFPGRSELAPLLHSILVRTIDRNGSLELQTQVEGKASVIKRVPVEGEARDMDGVIIHLLLHVVDWRPVELESFREDGSAVKTMPPASAFELVVLPPAPKSGWASSNY